METASRIIGEWYSSAEIDACIRSRFPADLVDDVKQDLFTILLEINPDLIVALHQQGKLRFYIVRVILNLSRQERNVVFKNYRPKRMSSVPDFPTEQADDGWELPEVERKHGIRKLLDYDAERFDAIGRLHWYEQKVFELWVELGSLQKVADFTTIDYNSLKKTVRTARAKVRRIMEEQ